MGVLNLVEKAEGAAVATDLSNRVLEWNNAAEELFALSDKAKRQPSHLYDLIDALDSFGNRLPQDELAFLGMTQRGEPVHGFEITAVDADSERIRISVLPVVVLAEKADDSMVVYFLRPMYRRRRADEAIERILSDPVRTLKDLDPKASRLEVVMTERQREVLKYLAQGLSNAEIARALNISVNTVRTHVQSLLERLEVSSRVQAVAMAFREGLI